MDRAGDHSRPTAIAVLQLLQCFTLAGNNAAIMWHIAARAGHGKTSAIALYALLSGGSSCSPASSWAARCTGTMRPAASW